MGLRADGQARQAAAGLQGPPPVRAGRAPALARSAARAAIAARAAGLLALAGAGCGSSEAIERGGVVTGPVLSVYSSLPLGDPVSRDIVAGAKLALRDRGGRIGRFEIRFKAVDEGASPREAAAAARAVIDDRRAVAVIGGLETATTRATAPLLNAAGVLQVALGAGHPGLTRAAGPGEPERYEPSARQTFARLVGDDAARAAALAAAAADAAARVVRVEDGRAVVVERGARSARAGEATAVSAAPPAPGFARRFTAAAGRAPSRAAALGHAAMVRVLDAIAAAGDRARVRQAVVDAFLRAGGPLAVNARGELAAPVFEIVRPRG